MTMTAEEYSREFDAMYGDHTPDLPASKAEQAALEGFPVEMAEITLEDLQKATEEVFGKESEFPRKLADNLWQLSPNCYGNDKAYMEMIRLLRTSASFDVEPKKRRSKK